MCRRRGKGEASFLHYKSPGREEPDVTNRGRGMEVGEKKEAKRDKKEEKKVRGGNRGGAKQMWERKQKLGRKKRQKEVLDESREGGAALGFS